MAKKKNTLLLIILAVFLPPVAVVIDKGFGKVFILNLILTLIFFLPGMIYALWLVTK